MKRLIFALAACLAIGSALSAHAGSTDENADDFDLVVLSVQQRDPSVKPILESLPVQGGGKAGSAAIVSPQPVAGASVIAPAADPSSARHS